MRRRIPHVQQMEVSDCGAACLAMALAAHGRAVSLREARAATGEGAAVSALAIVEAAPSFGLRARGVRVDLDQVELLPRGSILHWELDHFVVLERARRGGAVIVDPALGRRRVSPEDLDESFTGVAILLEPAEGFVRSRSPRGRLRRALRPLLGRLRELVWVLLTSVLIRALAVLVPLFTALLVDRVLPRGDHHLLVVMGAAMLGIVAYHLLSELLRAHLLLQLRTRLDVEATRGFLGHLLDLPYRFFLTRSSGDLLMRLDSTVTVREILTAGTLSTLLDGLLAVLSLAVLAVLSPVIALATLGLGLLHVGLPLLARGRNRRLMATSLAATARVQSYEYEMLAGIETLKAAGAEARALEHWTGLFHGDVSASLARGRLAATVDAVMSTLALASPLTVLVLGGTLVLDGGLSLGTMLGAVALATGVLEPLGSLAAAGLELQLLGGYLDRIDDVLDTPTEQAGEEVTAAPRLRGEIRAENVSFAYTRHGPPVIDDVSLTIERGRHVAIVGESGSGKSTLGALLLGLCRAGSGRVLLDGVDATRLEARSVRLQVGVVTQQVHLFGTSVRGNIALARPDASLYEVKAAARLACIHEDVEALPTGYDSVLADGGASLSGGQRQRIALARALLGRPAVLLLDEATSALDTATERRIHENLADLGCTVIAIAHRLSTVVHADLIVVLDRGRIVERGTHAELIATGGRYRRLVELQGLPAPSGYPPTSTAQIRIANT